MDILKCERPIYIRTWVHSFIIGFYNYAKKSSRFSRPRNGRKLDRLEFGTTNHVWYICRPSWENPAKVIFQMSMFMSFANLYHVQNIWCKGHHSISNITLLAYILKCWSWKKVIFRYYWMKELYWNTIHFNDIRCNFKALLDIFLYFGMDKMYKKGIFTIKKLLFFLFLLFPFFS
jgi:hypothetical protein